jgi:hypothetical protein
MAGASVTWRTDQGGIDRLLHSEGGEYGQYLTRLGNQMVNAAKEKANVDTGLMRSRVEFRLTTGSGGTLEGELAARTNYSFYVHRDNPFLTDAVAEVLNSV